MADYYPLETPFRGSGQHQQAREAIVQIVRQHPGISIGGIRKLYYGDKPIPGQNITGLINNLCLDRAIEHRPIDTYYVVGE
jgi:hypothetical protein